MNFGYSLAPTKTPRKLVHEQPTQGPNSKCGRRKENSYWNRIGRQEVTAVDLRVRVHADPGKSHFEWNGRNPAQVKRKLFQIYKLRGNLERAEATTPRRLYCEPWRLPWRPTASFATAVIQPATISVPQLGHVLLRLNGAPSKFLLSVKKFQLA
ncbi:hypothetical protein BDQ17DRAFT_1323085 [Cyathus striatus]|nr:hypothetical protein BDQ17DRAFT_1323085 [Cyathus striatus]